MFLLKVFLRNGDMRFEVETYFSAAFWIIQIFWEISFYVKAFLCKTFLGKYEYSF